MQKPTITIQSKNKIKELFIGSTLVVFDENYQAEVPETLVRRTNNKYFRIINDQNKKTETKVDTVELMDKTRNELKELAEERGHKVLSRHTKQDIVDMLETVED